MEMIPATLQERMNLRRALRDFVQAKSLCPPVSLKQLEALAEEFFNSSSILQSFNSSILHWLMVEINNQLHCHYSS